MSCVLVFCYKICLTYMFCVQLFVCVRRVKKKKKEKQIEKLRRK